MTVKNVSPKINSIEWGKVKTNDGYEYKDVKLYPGGSRIWDWNETGTHHQPGIQPADVQELIDHGADTIILSRGFNERLHVCGETKTMLRDKGIQFHILETGQAAKKYNFLREDHSVGALIHSTC